MMSLDTSRFIVIITKRGSFKNDLKTHDNNLLLIRFKVYDIEILYNCAFSCNHIKCHKALIVLLVIE